MAFYNGSSTVPGLINLMADKLVASDSKFTNPYYGLTRYTGDATDVDYGVSCNQRRVVKWEDPAKSGQEKTIYIVFQAPWYDTTNVMLMYRSDAARYTFGIEITVSSTWDSNTHLPGSDAQRTFLFVAYEAGGMSALQRSQLMALNIAYWMWVDDDALSPDIGNGLVIMTKPDTSTWGQTASCCLNIEKLTSKEYSDGYSLWHLESFVNYFYSIGGNMNSVPRKWSWYLHPWSLNATDDTIGDSNDHCYVGQSWWGLRGTGINTFDTGYKIIGVDFPMWAALSQGGSPPNVYFMKGIAHAEARYNNKPLGIIHHCFPWREGTGIIDQDIISEASPSTTKYVCLAKESPSSATKLPMAIKYAY